VGCSLLAALSGGTIPRFIFPRQAGDRLGQAFSKHPSLFPSQMHNLTLLRRILTQNHPLHATPRHHVLQALYGQPQLGRQSTEYIVNTVDQENSGWPSPLKPEALLVLQTFHLKSTPARFHTRSQD
jgi:hypothetical protein